VIAQLTQALLQNRRFRVPSRDQIHGSSKAENATQE